MEIEAGPNWDDDLGGSPVYAANDPNLGVLTDEERAQLNEIEQMVFFYLPRICNHCINPACVAACPAGALYKRGEDGIVLVNQDKCRAWRMCISGCPYKKVYYNWSSGKSEKCILCFPRLESGQAPACFHSCVGRIRYLGVLLYDADRIEEVATAPEAELVEAQRGIIQDPFDPEVIAAARASGVPEAMLDAARHSPVYKFVKQWRLALPLHPEFRTLPMLYYVPPMLPVLAKVRDGNKAAAGSDADPLALPILGQVRNGTYDVVGADAEGLAPLLSSLEAARVPLRYMARLFAADNEDVVTEVYRKLIAVRVYKRAETVGDVTEDEAQEALAVGNLTAEEAEAIFRLTALPSTEERFVVPPLGREMAIEQTEDPYAHKREAGFGTVTAPKRRW
jgi:nitrate reductase beta subunit